MGLMIGVKCDGCSYDDEMFVGGTRQAAFEDRQWPVLCRGCRSITTSHYSGGPLKCLRCGSDNAVAIDHPEISAEDGECVMHSWFGAELPTTRPVMRTQRVEFTGWRRLIQWLLRKLEGPSADYEAVWTEEPDYERHEIRDGNYLCPWCGDKKLHFPSLHQAMAIVD